jgi:D-galactarolactone cycloisomerase
MLEYDTTPNLFRENILTESLGVLNQVKTNGGWVDLPKGPGLGIEIDFDFVGHYRVDA